ncbi:hypothetical protein NsoK4_04020 [Nitrosopumilus sp. K4]|uniref:PKD domain-containing protein n=1 Tax=Nitrosopumilus sp. K4 TaxID=2795383 RepID=UPI001BACBC95|nr:PKD domain-containing protein [Nitrosopumilus sp. K4]QUC65419.1 hypothetical protein NsoK4_04020 [Nitrosopumilus sp. K4]
MKKTSMLFSLFLIPLLLHPAYALNSLQDTTMKAQNSVLTLEFEFGPDEIKEMRTKTVFKPTLADLSMTLYGDVVDLSDSRLKVYSNGKLFSILHKELGIVMYGKYQENLDNYKINVYFATDNGLKKQTVTTGLKLPEDKVIVSEPKKEKTKYIPDLKMTSSHDFRTYWKDTFNIDVQAFDGKINSNPKQSDFNGRIDGVDVKVILSLDNKQVATLSGVTANNGHWAGEYYVNDRFMPGEYTVDVIISHLGKAVSKSSSMFIIGTTAGGGTGNHAPVSNAGSDQSIGTSVLVTLDGSGSSDPDGDTITYSWTQTSGTLVTLSDETAESPTFTSPVSADTLVFELTVTDDKGSSDTDSVTIVVS